MKTTYIVTRITFSATPSFEVLGSYELHDLALLEKARQELMSTKNDIVSIQEVIHNDTKDLEVEGCLGEVIVLDEDNNEYYIEVIKGLEHRGIDPEDNTEYFGYVTCYVYNKSIDNFNCSPDLKKEIER